MWQRPFVLENLTEITAVNPAATGRTSDEMLRFVLRWIAHSSPEDGAGGMSDIRERLLRAGFSLDTKMTILERDEIVARPPLGCRTGEDRNVAAPVIVEILDTPLARAEAILVDRNFPNGRH